MPSPPDLQAPALNRRRVGDYVVTYLSDGFLDGSFAYLSGIGEADAKAMLEEAHRPPLAHFAIASYVIQGNGRTILVDAGTGGSRAGAAVSPWRSRPPGSTPNRSTRSCSLTPMWTMSAD